MRAPLAGWKADMSHKGKLADRCVAKTRPAAESAREAHMGRSCVRRTLCPVARHRKRYCARPSVVTRARSTFPDPRRARAIRRAENGPHDLCLHELCLAFPALLW
jgi:hypothetical protein